MTPTPEPLTIKGDYVTGEISVEIPPGTISAACDRAVTAALGGVLSDAAERLSAVIAAPAHKFARPLPGKDAEGRTRYTVRARTEGGRLIPDHSLKPTKPRRGR